MGGKSKGYRRKTRSLMGKAKGMRPLTAFLRQYKVNDKVVIVIDPQEVKGMPHRRFHGRVGTVEEVRRRSLLVRVPVGEKIKRIFARLEHVKPLCVVAQSE